jgi:hypothetical protein
MLLSDQCMIDLSVAEISGERMIDLEVGGAAR